MLAHIAERPCGSHCSLPLLPSSSLDVQAQMGRGHQARTDCVPKPRLTQAELLKHSAPAAPPRLLFRFRQQHLLQQHPHRVALLGFVAKNRAIIGEEGAAVLAARATLLHRHGEVLNHYAQHEWVSNRRPADHPAAIMGPALATGTVSCPHLKSCLLL